MKYNYIVLSLMFFAANASAQTSITIRQPTSRVYERNYGLIKPAVYGSGEDACASIPYISPEQLSGGWIRYITGYHYKSGGCTTHMTEVAGATKYESDPFYQRWVTPAQACPDNSWSYSGGMCTKTIVHEKTDVCPINNPVYPSNGSKIQTEWDFHVAAPSGQWGVKRSLYNRSYSGFGYKNGGWFMDRWHRTVSLTSDGKILATRGPGDSMILSADSTGIYYDPSKRVKMVATNSGYMLYDQEGLGLEVYGANGLLTKWVSATGDAFDILQQETFSSIDGSSQGTRLSSVTHFSGRSISFDYDANKNIKNAKLNLNQIVSFSQNINFDFLLDSVSYLDGTKRTYLYETINNPLIPGLNYQQPTSSLWIVSRDAVGGSFYTNGTAFDLPVDPVLGPVSKFGITGIIDENGNRGTTYRYNSNGQVTHTEYNNGTQTVGTKDYAYNANSSTSVTDAFGALRTMSFTSVAGMKKLASSSQPAGSGCNASTSNMTYDSVGNVLSQDDFDGRRTCYGYDATRNLQSARVEGLSTSAACSSLTTTSAALPVGSRKISTQWHPDWSAETKRAEPGKITTFVYNGQPDPFNANIKASCAPVTATLPDGKPIVVLCKQVEQATTDTTGTLGFSAAIQSGVANRIQVWTYNQYGQVLTYDGPRTDVVDKTKYAYYSDTTADHTLGDLMSVTDASSNVTNYKKYNAYGQLLEMSDPNSVVTSFVYDLRQRLKSETIGGLTTNYDYYRTGLLKQVTQPDGSFTSYNYDGAQRLTSVSDNLGNLLSYDLDNAGNVKTTTIKDPSGVIQKVVGRVYDTLGRLKNMTGRE